MRILRPHRDTYGLPATGATKTTDRGGIGIGLSVFMLLLLGPSASIFPPIPQLSNYPLKFLTKEPPTITELLGFILVSLKRTATCDSGFVSASGDELK